MKRLSKVKICWGADFAYAIGLIATDGNLSKDGYHMNFTSKDRDLVELFKKCLGINNKIGVKARGGEKEKKYCQVQFGDKNFYEFLLSIGLKPAKSKTLEEIIIPDKHFLDFLRGCIDGDGSIGAFVHSESRHLQLRVKLASASPVFLGWIKNKICDIIQTKGGWIAKGKRAFALVYAMADAKMLLKSIYYSENVPCLERKRIIARQYYLRA